MASYNHGVEVRNGRTIERTLDSMRLFQTMVSLTCAKGQNPSTIIQSKDQALLLRDLG